MEALMKNQFVISQYESFKEGNIYANQSSVILEWLLTEGLLHDEFSLREVARETSVSLGLVQRIFKILSFQGLLQINGIRTSKSFTFKKGAQLLENWINHYSIIKKCKMRTYHSGLQGRKEILETLAQSSLNQKVTLALHTAADALGYKNNNLDSVELYINHPVELLQIQELLLLEPKEKGYEVLLIEPYYKNTLNQKQTEKNSLLITSPLLTYLDLYHFPLRGQEQADFLANRQPELKQIFKSGHS